MIENYLTPEELSGKIHLHVGHLAKLRLTGEGPNFIKAGRKVLYDPADVRDWLNERKVKSTSEAA